jgi:uncharacterized protein YodC (DUF2158 family)
MTDEIKPGDMVQLRSGGPNMSVARIAPASFASCAFAGRVRIHVGTAEIASTISELDLRRYCCRDSTRTCANCDFKFDLLKRCRHAGRISSTSV